ncbi:MFS transporter, DHA2 family, multidrug resistance protein [Dyella jiangningensis]|uniref:DHA2 family efflux MFS transporter permease subunit n=1 Tax=Dyella sp. AtDHG13 TaxID=1938897 RepID=UPI0008812EFB|nr:DHA2 family efflux MFS transporter permease subunit [Dyella sp. AtDHG13]PXV60842.1 DHA2 family multidrug resistance protein [Dyella sp. AtDHG13]SDK96120.1 MFS transporter, DHA2 family, multidrug resistance protein [Dyella jiangningensis]
MADNSAEEKTAEGLPPLHGTALVLLTIAVAFSTFMEVLDMTIVNVAVPHIAGSLGVSANEGTWTISSYSLASAIMQPLTGWIARRFGEVKTFVVSVGLFVVFSMMCGLATSMPMLVFARLMQGAGSGPMVALSLTLLLASYPKAKQGIALALWAMTVVVAPIFGPILGGWLTDNFSWPWIFYINLPVGVLAGVITWTLLRKRETKTFQSPIDVIGLVLLVAGVGCLQFMLDNGNDHDWFASGLITTLGIIALVCLTFLVVWELHAKHPVVDLTLFKQRNFTAGVIALSLGMFAFFGINVVFPLWLQTTLGYTATWAGLATAPVGILAFLLSPVIGRNMQKLELRAVVTFAFVVFAGTSYWFSTFDSGASFSTLVLPRFVMGVAIPCFFIPLNQIYLSGLPANEIASASGLANFFRTLGSSVSTAVTVTLWQHRGILHHATLTENVTGASQPATQIVGQLTHGGLGQTQALGVVDQLVNKEALTLAVNDIFLLCAVLFIVLIPVIWLAKPPFGSAGGPAH